LTLPEILRQTSTATRVLPIPPAPVTVTSLAPSSSRCRASAISSSRPNSRDLTDGTPSDATQLKETHPPRLCSYHALPLPYRAIARCSPRIKLRRSLRHQAASGRG